jgi:hypothetical protein
MYQTLPIPLTGDIVIDFTIKLHMLYRIMVKRWWSYIHIFRPVCGATDCGEDAKYERNITVSIADKPFTFTAFFCENHKDEAKTPWDDITID